VQRIFIPLNDQKLIQRTDAGRVDNQLNTADKHCKISDTSTEKTTQAYFRLALCLILNVLFIPIIQYNLSYTIPTCVFVTKCYFVILRETNVIKHLDEGLVSQRETFRKTTHCARHNKVQPLQSSVNVVRLGQARTVVTNAGEVKPISSVP
jgi:hypothetical protein